MFELRLTRAFFDPPEPEIVADLWPLGLGLMAASACLTIGGMSWLLWVLF